jgi:hypothetical protein
VGGLQESWFFKQSLNQPEAIARDALEQGSFSIVFRIGGELSSFILQSWKNLLTADQY